VAAKLASLAAVAMPALTVCVGHAELLQTWQQQQQQQWGKCASQLHRFDHCNYADISQLSLMLCAVCVLPCRTARLRLSCQSSPQAPSFSRYCHCAFV
jgi:hypothetical protein